MANYGGIPENSRAAARRGERVRFNGFWLDDTERDREIAAWLTESIAAKRNVSEIVKNIIYRAVTDAPEPTSGEILRQLSEIRAAITSGALMVNQDAPAGEIEDLENTLFGMGT